MPEIYRVLAEQPLGRKGVSVQQYDDFLVLWEESSERKCILANCRHSLTAEASNLLLPLHALPAALSEPLPKEQNEGRCRAVADSIGELVWMVIGRFNMLPIIEVATPVDRPQTIEALGKLTSRWISLSLTTYGVLFVNVEKKLEDSNEVIPHVHSSIGWFHDKHIADYGPSYEKVDLTPEVRDWIPYQDPALGANEKAKVPWYLSSWEYFTTHKGEIVAGYIRREQRWQLISLNGLRHMEDEPNPVSLLFGKLGKNSKFGNAVSQNVEVFRLWVLEKELHEKRFTCKAAGLDLQHQRAWSNHAKVVGCAPTLAITMTHNLVNEPLTKGKGEWETASTFANLLISVPSMKERPEDERAEDGLANRLHEIVRFLWDHVDIMKLPISRQLMRDKNRELEEQAEKHKELGELYERVQQPLNALLDLSRKLTDTAGRLSMLRGDHLEALIANRHTLAMRFEEGYVDRKYGHVKFSKHKGEEYDDYNELAAALLCLLSIIKGGPFDPKPGRTEFADELKATLSRLVAAPPENPVFHILAPRRLWKSNTRASMHASVGIIRELHDEWQKVPFQMYDAKPIAKHSPPVGTSIAALNTLKRRVHSNFKPSAIALNYLQRDAEAKVVTLDDLAWMMDANFLYECKPEFAPVPDDLALFDRATFPFGSIGHFFMAIMTFFKGKEVESGVLSFNAPAKTLAIEAVLKQNKSLLVPGSAQRVAAVLMQFKDAKSDIDSLLLGDFLTPLVALIQTRLAKSGEPRIKGIGNTLSIGFEHTPLLWTIQPGRMKFFSRKLISRKRT